MKNGLYRCDQDWHGRPTLNITVELKETDKSYVLTLVEDKSRFPDGHIEMMFRDSRKVTIPKSGKGPHAFVTGENFDNWFVLYPGRNGVPFSFNWLG